MSLTANRFNTNPLGLSGTSFPDKYLALNPFFDLSLLMSYLIEQKPAELYQNFSVGESPVGSDEEIIATPVRLIFF
jgi:hypothetical protein